MRPTHPRRTAARPLAGVLATLVAAVTAAAVALTAAPATAAAPDPDKPRAQGLLKKYTKDTWRSFEAMVVPETGLPADNIGGDLAAGSRSGYTSPTNIGAYLWSTVTARDTGLIDADEARERMATTLDTVAGLERHEGSGHDGGGASPAR